MMDAMGQEIAFRNVTANGHGMFDLNQFDLSQGRSCVFGISLDQI